jgi:SP family galactose:H+ symporter-like MFS transporter
VSTLGDRKRRRLLGWALSATIGGFLFGYQLGVISGALLFVRHEFGLSNFEQAALVSIVPLGAMAGGLAAGRLADALGRRRTLIADALVFIAGTVLAAAAPGYGLLLLGRGITGLAVGLASSTVPVYLSEIAPPDMRGRLVTANQLMVAFGIVASYCVDLLFAGSESWRAMFAVGLVPATGLLAGMLRAPETLRAPRPPRERTDWRRLAGPAVRPALIIGVSLAAFQQFSGINAVIYYGPQVMEHSGLSASNSILYSVLIGVVNVAATAASVPLVDRAGRRPLLLRSIPAMGLALALLGLTFETSLGSLDSFLSLLCLLAYIAAFAVGLGPIFWLLIVEIFPPAARAAGASVATAMNWFFNFVVGLMFLPLAAAIGQGATFWIFAAVCAATFGFVRRYVPETKDRGFAEIDAEVRKRFG